MFTVFLKKQFKHFLSKLHYISLSNLIYFCIIYFYLTKCIKINSETNISTPITFSNNFKLYLKYPNDSQGNNFLQFVTQNQIYVENNTKICFFNITNYNTHPIVFHYELNFSKINIHCQDKINSLFLKYINIKNIPKSRFFTLFTNESYKFQKYKIISCFQYFFYLLSMFSIILNFIKFLMKEEENGVMDILRRTGVCSVFNNIMFLFLFFLNNIFLFGFILITVNIIYCDIPNIVFIYDFLLINYLFVFYNIITIWCKNFQQAYITIVFIELCVFFFKYFNINLMTPQNLLQIDFSNNISYKINILFLCIFLNLLLLISWELIWSNILTLFFQKNTEYITLKDLQLDNTNNNISISLKKKKRTNNINTKLFIKDKHLIVGLNGSGKTQILKSFVGLNNIYNIWYSKQDESNYVVKKISISFLKKYFGYCPEYNKNYGIMPYATKTEQISWCYELANNGPFKKNVTFTKSTILSNICDININSDIDHIKYSNIRLTQLIMVLSK